MNKSLANPVKTKFFEVYIKDWGNLDGAEAIVVESAKLTFAKQQKLLKAGCVLLWDSAPSLEAGLDFASTSENTGLEYGAYPRRCTACGRFCEVILFRGKVYHEHLRRYVPFNGYLDEQCANGEDYDIKPVRMARHLGVVEYPKAHNKHVFIDR